MTTTDAGAGAGASPRIMDLAWGRIRVDGAAAAFKDAKVFPGGAREWDWNETGTRHDPGIQTADVAELLERGAEVVVLSRGMQERLRVPAETLDLLDRRGVEHHELRTDEAVRLYNELRLTRRAAGLFHSTC